MISENKQQVKGTNDTFDRQGVTWSNFTWSNQLIEFFDQTPKKLSLDRIIRSSAKKLLANFGTWSKVFKLIELVLMANF